MRADSAEYFVIYGNSTSTPLHVLMNRPNRERVQAGAILTKGSSKVNEKVVARTARFGEYAGQD